MNELDEQRIYQEMRGRISQLVAARDIAGLEKLYKELFELDIPNRRKNGLIDIVSASMRSVKIQLLPSLSDNEVIDMCRNEVGDVQRAAINERDCRNVGKGWWHSKGMFILTALILVATIGGMLFLKYCK